VEFESGVEQGNLRGLNMVVQWRFCGRLNENPGINVQESDPARPNSLPPLNVYEMSL
jgi:hypothetical protein